MVKAVLLKSLRINGVRVPLAKDGPTVIDMSEREFTTLEPRGVVRAATRNDLLLTGAVVLGNAVVPPLPAKAVASAVVDAPAVTAPKRGRPPKAAVTAPKRGRPPKAAVTEPTVTEPTVTETPVVASDAPPDEEDL